jgi:DNA-binding transcriptional ArsR family regulator
MSSTLDILFSSAARVQILHLFLSHSDSQFYQREIERETGQPIRAVQREVKRLEEMGLLDRSTEGNRVFYRLNPEFPVLDELTALFRSATGAELAERPADILLEPSTVGQPFSWIETPPTPPLPSSLRRIQIEGEWDRAY